MSERMTRRKALRLTVGAVSGVGAVALRGIAGTAGLLANVGVRGGIVAAAGVAGAGVANTAFAAGGRVLKIDTLASAAAVNVPMQAALRGLLQTQTGMAAPEVQPTARIPQIVQEVISGSADLGDADIASTLSAAEAGADIKIIGLSYNSTAQVFVTNADKWKSLKELGEKGATIAVNSVGDFMYVMLLGVFKQQGIATAKINFVEMGSSGDRARALLAGRVDAVPMQVEQAAELAKRGNFKILMRPWEAYDDWFSAVIVAKSSWLEKPENKTAAVAVLKSVLTAFRKTNADYPWFKSQVVLYGSSKDLKTADDAALKPVWETLTQTIKAFPNDMAQMNVAQFAKVIPVYKDTGALKGTVDLHKLIDRTYLEQALKELG